MTIASIALQVIIGLIFLFTGSIKLFTAKENLPSKGVTGFENISSNLIKLLALTEIIGALTLLIFSIPSLPHLPIKIGVSGFAVLMAGASFHHYKRKEFRNMFTTLTILFLNLVILFLKW